MNVISTTSVGLIARLRAVLDAYGSTSPMAFDPSADLGGSQNGFDRVGRDVPSETKVPLRHDIAEAERRLERLREAAPELAGTVQLNPELYQVAGRSPKDHGARVGGRSR